MKISSPLKGKYLVKNSYLFFFLKIVDFFSSFIFSSNKKIVLKNPQKILLSNIAHLGDLLISTSVLLVLKKNFPDCKIGFICSSSSKELIVNHPLIDKIYLIDHWKLNRSSFSFFKKFLNYFKTRSKAINEIRNDKYDVAIDLYSYFPNTVYLFWKAKIPIRIGYTSAGFKNFLTNSIHWINQNKHISSYHFDLIKLLGISEKDEKYLKINPTKIDFSLFADKKLEFNLPENFDLIHIGAGDIKKMWDINKWRELTSTLVEKGRNIVFTGKGKTENKQINEIIKDQKNFINLCDKLSLNEMVTLIHKAKSIICVDSLVLHLAAALNKSTFVIFCGINNHHHWVLKKDNVNLISKNIPCNPCYEKNGCDTMDCLNDIHVEDVLNKMERIFEKD